MRTHVREIGAAALYGIVGWAISAAAMSVALWTSSVTSAALAAHALIVPLAFGLVSLVYFRRKTPLRPVLAAALFATLVLALDALLRVTLARTFDIVLGTWLPAYAALAATWLTGLVIAGPIEREA